jgi:hypothetical protein
MPYKYETLKFMGSNGGFYPLKSTTPQSNSIAVKKGGRIEYFPLTSDPSRIANGLRLRNNGINYGFTKILPNIVVINYFPSERIYSIQNGLFTLIGEYDYSGSFNWWGTQVVYEKKTGVYFFIQEGGASTVSATKFRIGASVDGITINWIEREITSDETYYNYWIVDYFYDKYILGGLSFYNDHGRKIQYQSYSFQLSAGQITNFGIQASRQNIDAIAYDSDSEYVYKRTVSVSRTMYTSVTTQAIVEEAWTYQGELHDRRYFYLQPARYGNVSFFAFKESNPECTYTVSSPLFDNQLSFPGRIAANEDADFVYEPYSDKIVGFNRNYPHGDILYMENYDGTGRINNVNNGYTAIDPYPKITFAGYGHPE